MHVLTKMLMAAAELGDILAGIMRVLASVGLTRRTEVRTRQLHAKLVVVACVHESGSRPDLLALLRKLRMHGFETVVVSSNKAHEQYRDVADVVINVAPAGRDFLAYQRGYRFVSERVPAGEGSGIVFLNDSVWYFEKHQNLVVSGIVKALGDGALVAGTMILDEVPHVSGWLFAAPFTRKTQVELDTLFKRNFARKSRRFNIRAGEHRILPALASVNGVVVLDTAGKIPAIAHCYEAVALGTESFYVKADATVRVDVAVSNLSAFIEVNAEASEGGSVLRWLARRASSILRSRVQMWEAVAFRARYFPPTASIKVRPSTDASTIEAHEQPTHLHGEAPRRLAG